MTYSRLLSNQGSSASYAAYTNNSILASSDPSSSQEMSIYADSLPNAQGLLSTYQDQTAYIEPIIKHIYRAETGSGMSTSASPRDYYNSSMSLLQSSSLLNDTDSGYNASHYDGLLAYQPTSEPATTQLVAANQMASVWGDPHLSDPDANNGKMRTISQTVNKTGNFNLLQDNGVELNATFARIKNNNANSPTYVTSAGLEVAGQQLLVNADGTVKINDEVFKPGGFKVLADGTQLRYVDKLFTVKTPEEYSFEFHTQQKWQNNTHLDIAILTGKNGVLQDGVAPTGMLGKLFDADDQKHADFTEAEINGFMRDALFSPPQAVITKTYVYGANPASASTSINGSNRDVQYTSLLDRLMG